MIIIEADFMIEESVRSSRMVETKPLKHENKISKQKIDHHY